ncbi:MAG: sodium/proline symporter [Gemmatimonadota bacterium]|nr:sodium/proline symporter [Gemmatimonadota bacterium]
MSEGRGAMTLVLAAYFAVLVAIGWWANRDTRSVAGFYVADKKLPSWVIAFSSNTTGESGWLLLGLTGMGYLVGFHALWIVLGEVLGVAVAWAFVARPFKEYTDRYDSITVPDYLSDRFLDRNHTLRLVSAAIILSMVGAYTAAQLTASGKAFSSFLGISYGAGVWIGAVVILLYTSVGGFKAVAYSDLLQGILMFLCLLILPIVGIRAVGGWGELMSGIREVDASLLQPMGDLGLSMSGLISALGFAGIGLAFLGAPQLLTRFMSARDGDQIAEAGVIAVLCIIVFDVGAVLTGIAGRFLFPGLEDPETILPVMAAELFPPVLAGVVLVVVLAAIMSTVDSLLILASSAVVRDVIQKILDPDLSDRQLSAIGKALTVVIGLVGLLTALTEARMIFWFVLFAWSGLASAFTPVVLCSLFWDRTTKEGAVWGMLAGFVTTVVWVLVFKERFYDLYEMIPGFTAGFVVTVAVSLLTRPPDGAAAELKDVRATLRGRASVPSP